MNPRERVFVSLSNIANQVHARRGHGRLQRRVQSPSSGEDDVAGGVRGLFWLASAGGERAPRGRAGTARASGEQAGARRAARSTRAGGLFWLASVGGVRAAERRASGQARGERRAASGARAGGRVASRELAGTRRAARGWTGRAARRRAAERPVAHGQVALNGCEWLDGEWREERQVTQSGSRDETQKTQRSGFKHVDS
ncbi:hypothetical protein PVAP13_8NG084301 [Panicum virgatum]|uniref:Uncharacterized protein n=1 Tax=Panicum virgatum TaxID=38727 RepID=A0A8T0P3J3_PANVG|nr:hypothetical protein PVAP13_8NG084301 [Panicum virgatum]